MNAHEQIEKFQEFLELNYQKQIHSLVKLGARSITIDFNNLAMHDPILAEELINEPEETVRAAEIALSQFDIPDKSIKVRFTNLPESQNIKIKNIRSEHIDKFISFEGLVRQSSDVRPQLVSAKFECPSCGNNITIPQVEEKFKEPSRCSCGRVGRFKLIDKLLVDSQRLVLEEPSDTLEGGEQAKRLPIYLRDDLVEPKMEKKTTPGSRIKVFGIVREVPIPSKTGGQSTRYDLCLEANYVEPADTTYEEIILTEEDLAKIDQLSKDPKIYEKFTASIAPSILGHEDIKGALILQLMGGVRKEMGDGQKIRGDIHILLVGDPGAAKSTMIKFIETAAPRARYVVGRAATSAGITASVVRDEFIRGWALEAGAIVLASGGFLLLDEMDKMSEEDTSAMHEAMAQQCMMPNFKLMLSNGEYVEIGKFVDNLMKNNKKSVYEGINCEILPVANVELLSTDFQNHFPVKADRVSRYKAPSKFVHIELENGREIKVTPEHPCWIVENGKIVTTPAEKLKGGMYFPIPSEVTIREKPYKKENDALCKILGYHLSDGCYELNRGKKTGIQFWNNDEKLINDYKCAIEQYFKLRPIITRRKNQFAVRVISKKVAEKMKKMDGTLLEKGDTKKIPQAIMQLPKENIKYLLRALYDGDGSVSLEKRNGCRISFVSQNRELEDQMADLLLRFGIQSSIREDKSSGVWRLSICGQENLKKFLMEISFLSQHKKQKLKDYCGLEKTYRTIRDLVPNCTEKISSIFKKLGISQKKEIGHSIGLGVEKQKIFLQKLVVIAEKELNKNKNHKDYAVIEADLAEIKKLAFGYANWVKIKNVSIIMNKGIKWVYDVTIEPYRTFISNGMVLHNTVTISKANIQATLTARTSVLAAANPKFGRFDPYQPIASQIDLPPALINRFDLIFPVRDLPDKEKDSAIATHVLELHHNPQSKEAEINIELMRKYIAYAKQNIQPKLTPGAIEEIRNFYVGLRNSSSVGDAEAVKPIPISARQLESLVRLAEGSARIRLSNKVTRTDARKAIAIMRYCLMQVGLDHETGQIDIDRISTGITASTRNKIHTIREIINLFESRGKKSIPVEDIVAEATDKKITESQVEEIIEKLKREGEIYEPRRGFISKI